MAIRLWVMSDLHIDVGHNDARHSFSMPDPQPEADLCLIAGDIREGMTKGVKWIANSGFTMPVCYIGGNHEFYRDARDRGLEKAREEAAKHTGITVLQDEFADFEFRGEKLRVYGSTLWTDYCLDGEAFQRIAMYNAYEMMNDHRLIRNAAADYSRWLPKDCLAEHANTVAWLKLALNEPFDGKRVVMTHHAPSVKSISDQHWTSALNPAYASNLDDLASRVDLWVHGHIHQAKDYRIDDGRVVANPRGYAVVGEVSGWDPSLVVEV